MLVKRKASRSKHVYEVHEEYVGEICKLGVIFQAVLETRETDKKRGG